MATLKVYNSTTQQWEYVGSGVTTESITNYDFTHTTNTNVSSSVTTTFAANQRNSVTYTTSADLSITIVCNNSSDNYIWVINSGGSDIDITIPSFTYNGTTWTTSANIHVVGGQIVIPSGTMTEIGIVADSDGAKITSVNYGA